MDFPLITDISDVLPSIEGRKEFVLVERDGYTVIDYVYIDPQSLDDPIRAECRGLKFEKSGKLLARPFHKFFNFGERQIQYPWESKHITMDKRDGTMIHTAIIDGDVRFMTRMGITEHALRAEALHLQGNIEAFAKDWPQYTPIFEWTSPDNQIVIQYKNSQLTLLAMRHNLTGTYLTHNSLQGFGRSYEFPVIEDLNMRLDPSGIRTVQECKRGIEGYVVFFPETQQFVKIKTDEYVQMHRAVSFFEREDMILPAVLDSQVDDLYPTLSIERANKLRMYEGEILSFALDLRDKIVYDVETHQFDNRKDFALWVQQNVQKECMPAYFSILDGKDPYQCVKSVIIKHPHITGVKW